MNEPSNQSTLTDAERIKRLEGVLATLVVMLRRSGALTPEAASVAIDTLYEGCHQ